MRYRYTYGRGVTISLQFTPMNKLRHTMKRMMKWLLCIIALIVILLFATIAGSGSAVQEIVSDAAPIICVYNVEDGTLMRMDLESYLVGVVAAEMPATFSLEALKAQAVAARTFAIRRMIEPNSNVRALHPEAQITTSVTTCQAWINEETQRKRWGDEYDLWRAKIIQAVTETEGEVLCYGNELIDPVYHASCGGGYTEAAEQVWGNAVPYLKSVACNHPSDKYMGEKIVVSYTELAEKLQLSVSVITKAEYAKELCVLQRTDSNRIKELRIGEERFQGTTIRSVLGLKSTLFDCSVQGERITFTTNGYGHGVGMCQYGAEYYATQGCNYQQILRHYYLNTILCAIPYKK